MDGSAPIVGIPSREKLLHALYEAAELEHNLMCTYLYAAFSLKDGEGEGLSAAEAEAVGRWRRAIIEVAIDEMSHLVAVWNITSALGGAPQFGRNNFPLGAGYLPAGIVVKLAPFSEAVLQHFIHLERPHGSDEPDGDGFVPDLDYMRTPMPTQLTPAGCDYATVGELYGFLSAGLSGLAERGGAEATFIGDPALQLSPNEVDLTGARQVVCLKTALSAFDTIVAQGEGAPNDSSNSHFQRFLSIRDELRALKMANPAFAPAHPAAHNPVLRKPPHPDGRVWLRNPDAIATVDLANAVYGLTLRLLAGAYAIPGPDPEKSLYVDTAISLMRALSPLAERAARLPAGPSHPECNAGVSFTALRDAASLPAGPGAGLFYGERLGELADVAAAADQGDPRNAKAARILRTLADRLRDTPRPSSSTIRPPAPPAPPASIPAAPPAAKVGGLDVVEGRDITIQYNGKRCIHARFCVTRAPATFLANTDGPWILPDASVAEDVAAVIRQCPSGALTYRRRDGHDEAPPPVNLIGLLENGPYAVRGDLSIDGTPAGFRATLCRCGASKRKPFCDKSHKYVGFTASGEPASLPDQQQLAQRDGPLAVAPEPGGPLGIRGNLEIMSGTGRTVACVQTARLCRCGGSANKPFCDDTHKRIGFQAR